MKSKIFIFSASVALGLGGMACVNAQEAGQTLQKSFNRDAEFISHHYGLPLEDVQRQLRLQNSRGNLVENLREEFKERLAGIYIEHYPVDRIVVRLTGNLQIPGRELKIGDDNLRIDFAHGQEHSTAVLESAINNNWDKLRRLFQELQGAGTDDRTGEVVLHIHVPDTGIKKTDEMRSLAQEILKVPVRINAVPGKVENFFSVVAGGSLPTIACTSGFAVRNKSSNNLKGIITADHCPAGDSIYLDHENGFPIPLLAVNGINNSSMDVRWYRPYAGFFTINTYPEIYISQEMETIPVTGSKTRANTGIGDRVCHRGVTTGYSCGDVAEINHKPNLPYKCGPQFNKVECSDTWVSVVPPSLATTGLACAGGDSGGPVFSDTIAMGILKGGISNGTSIGACTYFFYMSVDYIDLLNVELIYGL